MKKTNKFEAYNETAERSYWYVEYYDETGLLNIEVCETEEEAVTAISNYERV
jgi:predicted RNase H-like HicB family nuclease